MPATLYLWPGTSSYTREPAAELHTLGSPPLLTAVVEQLGRVGARPAAPGEFTLRAFLAGRIDLTQAEAVLGIIDARGEHELRVALEQLAGGLTRPVAALRESLLDLLARLEAGLDFVEDDIEFIDWAEIQSQLERASTQVGQLAERLATRGTHDEKIRAVLVGPPNVGKSSLFNALTLAGALVSRQPGTTRDYLIAPLDLDGTACELIDTAGVESADAAQSATDFALARPQDEITRHAQDQTAAQAERAQIQLLCVESGQNLNAWQAARLAAFDPRTELIVLTKADRASLQSPLEPRLARMAVETSVHGGIGLAHCAALLALARGLAHPDLHAVGATVARAAESVRAAGEALARAQLLNQHRRGEELIAAEVRGALAALGAVNGAVSSDDVLGAHFQPLLHWQIAAVGLNGPSPDACSNSYSNIGHRIKACL